MNLLFVNYGDFTSNSLNHIGAFARRLAELGHVCAVAVPENPETISVMYEPLFTPVTYSRALESEPIFPDRRGADIVHAWTPRENVRAFALAYVHQNPAATLIIHLEDNEAFLIEKFGRASQEELRRRSDEELAASLSPRLSHPIRFRNFLRVAHAATYITDRLREFVPAEKPAHRLIPGIDASLYHPAPPDAALREELGLAAGERAIVFTGSTTFANLADVRSLALAVRLINERGTPCRLVRTGINPEVYDREIRAVAGDHILDLGFVAKERLPRLLGLADALVQPGTADAFNDYRLPSKIPEFMSVGRPVVVPRANLAREMEDRLHALLLDTGSAEEIAEKCLRIFGDEALARRLSEGAVAFAQTHFDLKANTAALLAFYESVRAGAKPIFPDPATPPSEDVLLLDGDMALRMRAKELTLAAQSGQIAQLTDGGAANRAEIAQLHSTLSAHQKEIAARQHEASERDGKLAALEARFAVSEAAVTTHMATLVGMHAELAADRAKIAALENDKAVLAHRRAAIEQENKNLQTRLSYQNGKLGAAQGTVEVLRGQMGEAAVALGRLTRDLDAANQRELALATEVRQREDKIRRMVKSFSWQITGPLRSLRRLLIDPHRKPPAGQPLRHEVDPGFAAAIDEPTQWDGILATGSFRGWVIAQNGAEIVGVRVRTAQQTFDGTYGMERADVAAGHPDHPRALRSGFLIGYRLPADRTETVALEALLADGRWACFAVHEARIVSSAQESRQQDYAAWVRRYDTLSTEKIVHYRARIEALPPEQRPLISVLMPVYNCPEPWLIRAIESVRAQLYPHWELCIADDASSAEHVRRTIDSFAHRDNRIKVVYRTENGHISASSNSALELVTGEFTALLDHDDELPPHALAEIVFQLAETPETDVIYSDEDKIDERGVRFAPYFKPDFLPDLLCGQNFVSHLSAFRTTLMRAVGGYRIGYEGSQDWDLTLRIVERCGPARVRHIPKVLYHWRAIAGSTARQIGEKNYALDAARRALADHFSRTGIAVEIHPVPGSHWRIVYPLPAKPPRVSIVIPTRNKVELLRACIGSIVERSTYPDYEIVVVNNRSDDPATLAYFAEIRANGVRVLDYDAPFNYSAINNAAVREASSDIVCLLNNDIEVITPRWLEEMVSHAVRPGIGAVGAMLYYPDNTIQHAGAVLGIGSVAGHAFLGRPRGSDGCVNRARLAQNYSAVTGACLLIRRAVYEEVGGLDETNLAVAFNDIDFCLRVRQAGYRNLWTPFAELYHHESVSRGRDDTPEKHARFTREIEYMRTKWGPLLDRDPAYSPNLTLERQDFSLAFPPR